MRQNKWKYVKEKAETNFDEYLILPEDEKHKITIKNWTFAESHYEGAKIIFRTDVIKIDGKDDNRLLVIKNYENVNELKKKLSKKTSIKDTQDLEITRKHDEETMDYYFVLKFK